MLNLRVQNICTPFLLLFQGLEWENKYNKIMNQIGFELKIFKLKIICLIG